MERFHMAAVMGWPVMHSLSPLMHNTWMEQEGLKGTYVPLAIEPGTLEPALRALHPLGFAGCNLTIPHKLDAMTIVDEVDEVARKIGAMSCVVVRENGTLFGTNNDWLGFVGNLKQFFPDFRADTGPVTVIGAGGGGRAVCYAMLDQGAREIRLVNRTPEEPALIAAEFGGPITPVAWAERHAALDGAVMVINATSQGMKGEPALDIQLDTLPVSALAVDIIYTPPETPFLAAARMRGNPTLNGLGMLLHQGPAAWKRWFGIEPAITDALRRRMEQALGGT
ncbi:MAG: shikimate dehydrogenase [Alphaproteobacteria bacterium]|nr:shikimate dehydrogenase [Alphaproteobacteria bacterium]